LIYDWQDAPVLLEQVMSASGRVDEALEWRPFVQTVGGLKNVNEPHAIRFFREYGQELQASKPLAAYLSTTVVSPDARDVILQFRCACRVRLTLNGREVEKLPARREPGVHPFFRSPRETVVMRLRPGENRLLVHARPTPGERPIWFFGAALASPGGEAMTDLVFR
jgi:hypothetical protein